MPGKVKFALFFLIMSLIFSISYIYSDDLYTKYLRFWHISVKKTSVHDAISKAELIRKAHEISIKKSADRYAREDQENDFKNEMNLYLGRMSRVFGADERENLTPEGKELALYAGQFFLESGDSLHGAEMIINAMPENPARDQVVPLEKAIRTIYDKGMHNDVVLIMQRIHFSPSPEILMIHAMSLFQLKKYAPAAEFFSAYEQTGNSSAQMYYYHAKALESLRRRSEAISYAEKAVKIAPRDREIKTLLVDLLNSEKRFKDAEKASR